MDTVHPPKEMCTSVFEFRNSSDYLLIKPAKNNFYTPGTKIKIVTENFRKN